MKSNLSLLAALTLAGLFTCLLSCRKIDTPGIERPQEDVAEQFFALPASATPEVKRVAERLRELHKQAGFLNDIAKEDGFPVWNKVAGQGMADSRRGTAARGNSAG